MPVNYGRTRSDSPAEYILGENLLRAPGSRSKIITSTHGGPGPAHGMPARLDAEGAPGERANSPSDGGAAGERAS